ncbi:MAG: hypothetical protein KDD66_03485 [Bdellovibrionales bacterium]|nr:hypothetical protein [Bdellovibrionales bacterium]
MSSNTRLELYFSRNSCHELERTVFSHELLSAPMLAVSGTPGAASERSSGVFRWGGAVLALTQLLVRSKLSSSPYVLEGSAGSLASSLDAALSKPPNWLLDMFGIDSHGNSLASKLFNRSNPERKRPGPVGVALNPRQLNPVDIRVFHGQDEADQTTLELIDRSLNTSEAEN